MVRVGNPPIRSWTSVRDRDRKPSRSLHFPQSRLTDVKHERGDRELKDRGYMQSMYHFGE